ncbi:hypothetical protein [Desulfobacter vibrioformis]|uniref:hypothetical protein n=1 Tax=Desulfobacter vibrioformis TaxID=34031 RepID=UPI000553A06B|nr:hypothetical protein [Desulfobacter vibrioformis]
MNKREVIIIGLAGLLAVYGLLNYFVLDKKKGSTDEEKIQAAIKAADAIGKTAQTTMAALKKNGGRDLAYLKTKAEDIWSRDPFIYYGENSGKLDDGASDKLPDMVYSGFIQLGENFLGIINGMEYSIGDLVIDIGYKVLEITPTKVTLLTQSNRQVTLYLQED